MYPEVRFLPAGDSALVAEFGREVDEAVNQRVHDMAHWLEERRISGVTEVLPTAFLRCFGAKAASVPPWEWNRQSGRKDGTAGALLL